MSKPPDPTPAEKQRVELRTFSQAHLRALADAAERFALANATPFGEQRYFARVAQQARALIVAIG